MAPARSLLRAATVVVMAAALSLAAGCSGSKPRPGQFAGKWKSSRMVTAPLYLYDNGEWEIKTDEGQVLQYGLWQLEDKRMVWNVKMNGRLVRDVNSIVSVEKNRFELRERDGSLTKFDRLDSPLQ